MASPSSSSSSSSIIWNTKTIYDSASKISCYFSTIPNSHNKRPSSSYSYSSCSTSYYAATFRHTINKKSPENERTHDVTFSVVHNDDSNRFEQKINKAKDQSCLKMGSKAIARKLKFWFASKKMRSIILLNVITIVYGIQLIIPLLVSYSCWVLFFLSP